MEEIRTEEVKSLVGATPEELAKAIAEILDNKKGKDVKVIEVGDKTIIADYFVLANGNTNTHVRALVDEVEYRLGLAGVDPVRTEGVDGNNWRVLDYASVLVHVFDREAREFYNLDKLYTDFE
jgi:ribosome-associated protein